jgi:hypothetical protein
MSLALCPKESLRKLAQLHPVFDPTQPEKRHFDQVSGTDLESVLDSGDQARLVPFLVSAVIYLDQRCRELETRIGPSPGESGGPR